MDFKLVSKNNMGIVATLILVILLSQSKFFNFLVDTGLGRTVLIIFIIIISYVNKILGVVAVLFIIIIFNQSNIGYIEGFTENSGNSSAVDANKIQAEKLKLNKLKLQNANSSSVTASTPPTGSKRPDGKEGFNTVDRETTMLRGKRSNEIPVLSNARAQTDDVEPNDMSISTNAYSSF